ncbi:L-lysine exporter family protein LysE/ArgO [Litorimonas taeanensis]|uniref:L-lysine exporter family protein LysE/ArgO n=1 Tax=Litorimonas taeanensis TaxID=568099 RepID=A0A420WJN9_9PROT|nr:LysE/ArgO family amino acid transporter [Litorimonas taeanensis]RKQ71125.1 L-lysine exporter family protein LysE/ArgO [Litorimonas taeanensis]
MTTIFSGFALTLVLIFAIGAQNAFVLRQGLRRQHVLAVVLVCAISDTILIIAGVSGFGYLMERASWLEPSFTYAGAAFLFFYGARSAFSAWTGGQALVAGETDRQTVKVAIMTTLALTWLNPHVYLDTVILLGSIAAQSDNKILFGIGAITASFSFFFTLGYGARFLAPYFSKPFTWRILDGFIAVIMWSIAAKLILG